jgi:two-component system, NtrC family, sensor kinase
MRLKSSIFLWVSMATVIPLSALVLGITAYSERLYRQNVEETIQAGMKNIVSELEFRFIYEREVMLSLASSPAVKQFTDTLNQVAKGELPSFYFDELTSLNEFLTGFQHSVPGVDAVRVMDQAGNTLVKVTFGKQQSISANSVNEKIDVDFLGRIRRLKPHSLLYGELYLPQQVELQKPLLNPIVPLDNASGEAVGFLAAESIGNQLDHLLQVLPRSHNYKIEIVELNEANAVRNGLILYSDSQNILFNQLHMNTPRLWQQIEQELWNKIEHEVKGSFYLEEQSHLYYFQEFHPYNNKQVSWVVMLQLDEGELNAPFNRIRIGLLIFAALALLISLALADLGARYIANPIARFSAALKRFADGEKTNEIRLNQPRQAAQELQQLEQSFKYLVKKIKESESQRDQAQNMMLQQAKLASIGEMAAGIGHEINNPLNNILSYATLIERDLPQGNAQLRKDVDGLREEALRAGRIVKGILNFARQVPPEYNLFDMHKWLQDTIDLVDPEARKHQVTIRLHELPDLEMYGDRNQLQQVMVNLLMNAIQASKPQDVVEISGQKAGVGLVRIFVSDQGKGIDESSKAKIFDPFFTTKAIGEGSGLGLSISLGIIQFHNGQLELKSNSKGGVDAIITLPLGNMSDESE